MSRFRSSFLLTLAFLFSAGSVLAGNIAVGTCKPKLPSFSTISAAVAAVPAGSTVMVCSGTYPEQVTISQPLTLEGIADGDSGQVVITVPAGGLSINAADLNGAAVAAQVLVTAGPVNITNITIDGALNGLDGSAEMAGVLYASGSSGVIKQVTTRNQFDSSHSQSEGLGVGIWALNANAASESVTIQGCSVRDFDNVGIFIDGNITATVKANSVNGTSGTSAVFFVFGIAVLSGGTITNNTIIGPDADLFQPGQGITVQVPSVIVSDNVLVNWGTAILDFNGATYTNNTILNTTDAIELAPGATANSNTITETLVGIDFGCQAETVSHNTINDAEFGIRSVPSSFTSSDTFLNVQTIRSGNCASDASAALSRATETVPITGTDPAAHTPKKKTLTYMKP
ncbi:MAG TPA: hypothetical protein VOA88_19215 [Candidatus Dormibacteraeota bacterium]|nr:hypothetical protein [Candidatus Dormibacteraeota bacterium]